MLIIKVTNDDTGDERVGNYDYAVLVGSTIIAEGRVDGHERSQGWKELIRKLLLNHYGGGV